MTIKRTFVLGFLLSLLATALIAIGVLLFGQFGQFEIKVLVSSLSVGVYSLIALACATVHEKRSLRWLSNTGILLCTLGLAFALATNWQVLKLSADDLLKFRFVFLNFSMAVAAIALVLRVDAYRPGIAICQLVTVVCVLISSTLLALFFIAPSFVTTTLTLLLFTKILSVTVILGLLGVITTPILGKVQDASSSSHRALDLKVPLLVVLILIVIAGVIIQRKIKNTPPNAFDPSISRQSLLPVVSDPRLDPNALGPEKTTILYELACDEAATNPKKNTILLSLINNPKTDLNWIPSDYEAKIRFSNREGIVPTPLVCMFDYISDEIFDRLLSDPRTNLNSDQLSLILSDPSFEKAAAKQRFEKVLATKKVNLDQPLQDGSFLLDYANRLNPNQGIVEMLRNHGATKSLQPMGLSVSPSPLPVALPSPSPLPTRRTVIHQDRKAIQPASSLAFVQKNPLYQAFLNHQYDCHVLPNVHGYTQLYVNRSFKGNFTDQQGERLLSDIAANVQKGFCKPRK